MGKSFDPDWCIRPGLTLEEELAEIGLPMKSYARMTGLTEDHLQAIIAGAPITEADADALARLPQPCVSARVWLALEHNYRAALAAGKKDISDE